jgi:uncharacterized protein with PIN domain
MKFTRCPVCGAPLSELRKDEKKLILEREHEEGDVKWCKKCKELVYESDCLCNPED